MMYRKQMRGFKLLIHPNRKDRRENRSFQGFTLIELLAVIVILSVIALIATPIVINQIEQVRKEAFLESARNTLDAGDIYVLHKNDISSEGTDIEELELKNKANYNGLIFKNNNGQYILKNFTDGRYCASGTREDLVVRKGNCSEEINLYPNLSLSVKEKTTRKITVVATASDDTGIQGYAYCIADCGNEDNWKNSEQNEYTFDSLTSSKNYEIHVRVMNRIDKVTEKAIEVMTENLPTASYSVNPSGWARSKIVTITYPNNVENYLIVHSGSAKIDDEVITIGERRKISGTSAQIIFETNGTIEAITSDGYNEVSSSTLTISQIDITNPENVSVGIGSVTSNSIQVIANGVDNESGIAKYEFQVNGGSWIDNGTNNTYLFSNLTSGSYTYKVRLTNKAGGVTESSEKVQATTTIVTPSYSVSPSGWTTNKTATITYQSGYTNQFRVLTGSATYNGTAVTNNTWITISGTSAGIVFSSNGTIEARSTDGVNTVTSSTLTISQIDTTVPVVGSLSIASTNGSYNVITTIISSTVTDNSGASIQMYISNTGYETGGSWEAYSTSKAWNVGGTLNGGVRTVYITYKDQAGNKLNRTITYTVYNECGSGNTTTSYGGWGACSKTCGGGTQSRSVTVTDNKTAKVCSTSTGTQSCNTQSCNVTFNFDSATELNSFTTNKWKSKTEYPDATLTIDSGTAYFYTSNLDSFVSLRLNNVSVGISTMEFRMANFISTQYMINEFTLTFSDSSTIQFIYNHRNTSSSSYNQYLPLPSSNNSRFVVVNNQTGAKTDIGSYIGVGSYVTYYITVSGSTLTMTDSVGHSYIANIGSRKLISITFNPLNMWWGGGTSARLDYLKYSPLV